MGAYGSALLVSRIGLPFWLAIPIAGALAAGIGGLVALPALRLKNLYLAIAAETGLLGLAAFHQTKN